MRRWAAPLAARTVLALIGLALAIPATRSVENTYRDIRDHERAPHCSAYTAGDGRECITTVTVVVVSRSTYTTNDDPDPFPHQPPQPPPMPPPMPPIRLVPIVLPAALPAAALPADVVSVAAGTTVHYKVTIRMPSGKRRELKVSRKLYDKAKPGTTAHAEMWRGHLTRLSIGSESTTFRIVDAALFTWLAAWAGVVVLVGAIMYRLDGESFGTLAGGWIAGAVLFYIFKGWAPATFVVPGLVVGALLVWRALQARCDHW